MEIQLNPRHAIYVGSFDPMTLGHLDIITRGTVLYEKVTVGIGINPDKTPLFSPEERLELTQKILQPYDNVEVTCFCGLAVNFVKESGSKVMLRGMRTLTDIESEFTMSLANRTLEPNNETEFLKASEKYSHISSSLIKQIALLGRNGAAKQLADFIPEPIIEPLLEKFQTT